MKTEIKEKWLTALRSGNYKQTKGTLRKNNSFCCLGVLCDIVKDDIVEDDVVFNNVPVEWKDLNLITANNIYEILGESDVLPPRVVIYCGLDDDNPSFELNEIIINYLKNIHNNDVDINRKGNLAELNDAGADFNFIADVIEKNL